MATGWSYGECLKNHGLEMGIVAYVLDGCREFRAAGEEGTPDASRCANCSCHRSFHRKRHGPGVPWVATSGLPFYHPHSPYWPAWVLPPPAAPRPPPPSLPSTSGTAEDGDEVVDGRGGDKGPPALPGPKK